MKTQHKRTPRAGFEYQDDRDNELLKVFNQVCMRKELTNMDQVYETVAKMPCSRFYVSEERAFRIVSSLMKRECYDGMTPMKQQMYKDILRRVRDEMQRHTEWTLSRVVYYVVNHPAPSFYLTAKSVMVIVYRIKRKKMAEERKKATLSGKIW